MELMHPHLDSLAMAGMEVIPNLPGILLLAGAAQSVFMQQHHYFLRYQQILMAMGHGLALQEFQQCLEGRLAQPDPASITILSLADTLVGMRGPGYFWRQGLYLFQSEESILMDYQETGIRFMD